MPVAAQLLLAATDTPQVVRFHGGGYDRADALTVDGAGNAYVAGAIDSNGASTFGVVKLSPQGSVVWSAHYNGSAGGVGGGALAVAVDTNGNVYAAGYTGDGVIFNTNFDQLVVKFGNNGAQQWAQRYNGPARLRPGDSDRGRRCWQRLRRRFRVRREPKPGIRLDDGQVRPNGAEAWRRVHSGPGQADDRVVDMVLAPSGGVVVTGFTKNLGDGMTNDIDTLAYDPAGNVRWQARWTAAPTSHETPADLDIDAAGRVAITGTTAENPGPYAVPSPVTLRYDAAGALLQTLPGIGGASVDVDAAGNTVATGFFFVPPATSTVTRIDASGQQTWSSPLAVTDDSALSELFVRFDPAGTVTAAATVINVFTHAYDYLTIRFGADGGERWRHQFDGPIHGSDRIAGLEVDGTGVAWVTGTSWNNYGSLSGGTADDIVSLRFPSGSQPALVAPSGLDARALSRSQIRLRWQDNAGTETGARIERCTGVGCTNFVEIATVATNVTEHVDSNLARNTQYTYRVRAFNAQATSQYSNTPAPRRCVGNRWALARSGSSSQTGSVRSRSWDIGGVKRQIVRTDEAPSSPLYSQAVRVGTMVYVAGMAGIDVATKQLAGDTIEAQTRQALRNCAAVLEAAGGTLDDVVQVTVLLADPADFAGMNEEYAKVFAVDPPARAVAKLGVELPNLRVSVMMTAHVQD